MTPKILTYVGLALLTLAAIAWLTACLWIPDVINPAIAFTATGTIALLLALATHSTDESA